MTLSDLINLAIPQTSWRFSLLVDRFACRMRSKSAR